LAGRYVAAQIENAVQTITGGLDLALHIVLLMKTFPKKTFWAK